MARYGDRGFVLAALAIFLCGCHARQGPSPSAVVLATLRGVVRDSATGQPIPGTHVRASYDKNVTARSRILAQVATDSLGHFALTVPARGRVYISARCIGYAPMVASIVLPRDTAQTVVLVLPGPVIYLQD